MYQALGDGIQRQETACRINAVLVTAADHSRRMRASRRIAVTPEARIPSGLRTGFRRQKFIWQCSKVPLQWSKSTAFRRRVTALLSARSRPCRALKTYGRGEMTTGNRAGREAVNETGPRARFSFTWRLARQAPCGRVKSPGREGGGGSEALSVLLTVPRG